MEYALVTGASSGIGLEYARGLAARGYGVVVVSNRQEENEKVADAIRSDYPVEAFSLYADLTESDSADRIYQWCEDKGIRISVLVSNAGILHFAKLVHTDPAAIDRIIALHCTTPVKLCRLFAGDMCRRREGHILIMSSMTAWTPYPTMSLYGSTKVFLRNFGQSLWYEFRDANVSVTTVFPGAVDTSLYNLDGKLRRRLCRIGLMSSPEKVAAGGLRAMFGKKRKYVPGVLTRIEIVCCKVLPAFALVPMLRIPALKRILDKA